MALPKASDNPFPSVLTVEGTTPATPSAGQQRLFVDSADHKVKRVNSSGVVTVVEASGAAVSPLTTKGDLWGYTSVDARVPVGSNYQGLVSDSSQTPGVRWVTGTPFLLYDYTVAGVDKASIDTSVDTPTAGIAGTSAFIALRTLEVYMILRTDDAAALAVVDVTLNGLGTSIYDYVRIRDNDASVSGTNVLADSRWQLTCHGSSGGASYPGIIKMEVPAYADTTFFKMISAHVGQTDSTAANNDMRMVTLGFKSTSAVTSLKVAAQSTAKLKVGSRILIYAR